MRRCRKKIVRTGRRTCRCRVRRRSTRCSMNCWIPTTWSMPSCTSSSLRSRQKSMGRGWTEQSSMLLPVRCCLRMMNKSSSLSRSIRWYSKWRRKKMSGWRSCRAGRRMSWNSSGRLLTSIMKSFRWFLTMLKKRRLLSWLVKQWNLSTSIRNPGF